ncbi:hypothetical protein HTG_03845 [Natrinema mahii]|nr:hypothetical protein HTG_03845 [Natrinema mahii]
MLRHEVSVNNIKKALKNPDQAVDETLYELFYRIPMTYANTVTTIGTNVFTREWDVLILLDTCRVDALRAVADEYNFISSVDSIRSVGGRSPEWIAKTFVDKYEEAIRETAYLTTNVFTEPILDTASPDAGSLADKSFTYDLLDRISTVDVETLGKCEYLFEYEPVGESGPLGHTEGGTPPRYVTDRGIDVARNENFDRLILHYLQPHPPYMSRALEEDRPLYKHERDWWGYMGDTGDRGTIWETYLDELRFVLDEVEIVLENVDADQVVISSDHGEAFGEFWEFGHKTGSMHPKVRNVPWVETSATDTGSYTPEFEAPAIEDADNDLAEQLEALGYKM